MPTTQPAYRLLQPGPDPAGTYAGLVQSGDSVAPPLVTGSAQSISGTAPRLHLWHEIVATPHFDSETQQQVRVQLHPGSSTHHQLPGVLL